MTREDQLIERCKAGDAAALDELVRMYYPDILRYCLWHAPDRQSAEDATQETFIKMIRHLQGYTHRHFRAFLYRIAANTCIDMQRRKGAAVPLPEGLEVAEHGYDQAEADADLQRMVSSLPSEQRELVLLRFAQQLTLREMAEVTGLRAVTPACGIEKIKIHTGRRRMGMKALEKRLSDALHTPIAVDGAQVARTVQAVHRYHAAKPLHPHIGFGRFVVMQARYSGIYIWLWQGLVLLALLYGMKFMQMNANLFLPCASCRFCSAAAALRLSQRRSRCCTARYAIACTRRSTSAIFPGRSSCWRACCLSGSVRCSCWL